MYNDLIPDNYINELIFIKENTFEMSFRLGDIATDCVERNPEEKKSIVYRAVGAFCGRKSRSIREYASIAKFYPGVIRKKYEVLSFDHFRTAFNKENAIEMLEWSVLQVDEMNRPATVDAMIAEFCYNEDENIIAKLMKKLYELFDRLSEELTPEQLKQVKVKINEIKEIIEEPELAKFARKEE